MKDLRELAKEYAQSVIDKETYRKSRKELIQKISSGEIKVKAKEYLAPLESAPDVLDDTTENMITQIVHPNKNSTKTEIKPEPRRTSSTTNKSTPPPSNTKQKNIVYVSIASIIIVCSIALAFLLFPSSEEDISGTTEVASVAPISSPGQKLIIELIQNKNWSQETLSEFKAAWQALSFEEREVANSSLEMKRLISTIHQKILDERALLSLGDADNAVANQRKLVNFSGEIGIFDERFVVVEPEKETVVSTVNHSEQTTPNTAADKVDTEAVTSTADIEPNIEENQKQTTVSEATALVETASEASEELVDPTLSDKGLSTSSLAEQKENITEQELKKKLATTDKEIAKELAAKTSPKTSSSKNACKTSLVKSRKPYCRDKIGTIGSGPTMVVIRNGQFNMGGENPSEQPKHQVNINNPFAMSVHEITFGEFSIYCKSANVSCPKQPWSGSDYPVVNVSHADAKSYAKWLSENTGRNYRLPSEAEWEYAARAGSTTKYPFGEEILITDAVFSDKRKLSAPLPKTDRSINKNKFRLYHMVGNVREWVADTWHDTYTGAPNDGSARIENGVSNYSARGGSYADPSNRLRSGAREKLSQADSYTGFRVVQELSE